MSALDPLRHAPARSAGFADPRHARVAALIYREAGIVLGPEKASMMNARLTKRIHATGAGDLDGYLRLIDSRAHPQETANLVSALTTNHTHFFREAHHFDFLRDTVLADPSLRGRPLNIWSAGCSSGPEPYSIAITARLKGRRVGIVGTDIDHEILARAERAVYSAGEMSGMTDDVRASSFEPVPDGWRVQQHVRELVRFHHLNLHAQWRFPAPFDVIFCRNVAIYFDLQAQLRLWTRFSEQLSPGGWLFIGHSERIPDPLRGRLRPVGNTIYQSVES